MTLRPGAGGGGATTFLGLSDTPASYAGDATKVATVNGAEDGLEFVAAGAPGAHKDTHDPEDGGDPVDTAAASEIVGVQAAAVGSSHSLARADHGHAINHGIADNKLVTVDQADAASGEYVRLTANGIESRSEAEFKADVNLEIGTDVLAEQTVGIADDNLVEMDDAGPAQVGEYVRLTANGLAGRTEAEMKADINLEIGTDVLAEQTIGIADNNLMEVDGSPNSAEYARFTANGLEGRTEAEFKGDFNLEIGTDVLAQQTIGIADDNLLEVDGSPNDNEYAKFTANGLEGRTYAELVTDLTLSSGINFIIDGGGDAITTGIKGDVEVPFACTITQVTMLADQSGSIVVDIWKDTYANFPPTDADSITAAAVPTISAAVKSQDSTLSGWTTSVTAGDILRFNVDSVATCERVTISLKVTRT